MKSCSMPVTVVSHFIRQRRTRTNNAHLTLQHVDDLRQLVHREAAHPASQSSQPRIVFQLSVDRFVARPLIGILSINRTSHQIAMSLIVNRVVHGPELEHQEHLPIHAHSLLLQEDRTTRFHLYQNRKHKPRGPRNRKQRKRHNYIHRPLQEPARTPQRLLVQLDHRQRTDGSDLGLARQTIEQVTHYAVLDVVIATTLHQHLEHLARRYSGVDYQHLLNAVALYQVGQIVEGAQHTRAVSPHRG